jgi:hypothetical protein
LKRIHLPRIFQPFRCNSIIRLGKNNDGGYLVNEIDIKTTSTLLSFGIGEDISFEKDFYAANRVQVIAYDSTIDNISDDFIEHISENVTSDNIGQILDFHVGGIFLKCDIDGSEYKILDSIILNSSKFTGIAIEFHGIHHNHNLHELINFIAKIDLRLIHVHLNNYAYYITDGGYIPDVIELTFSASNTNTHYDRNAYLPNKLDMPNNPDDDEFEIIFEGGL